MDRIRHCVVPKHLLDIVEHEENWVSIHKGIVNLFTVIDELSPRQELFRAISAKNGVNLPEKEDLFSTLREK